MRSYPTRENGEKMYQLECSDFLCRCSPDSLVTVVWSKDEPKEKCTKCKSPLIETMANFKQLPTVTDMMCCITELD